MRKNRGKMLLRSALLLTGFTVLCGGIYTLLVTLLAQVFFPMAGSGDGWNKLAKTLKAEINQDLIKQYEGCESIPFEIKSDKMIAVKIIDDRGIESLKIIKAGEK